MVRSRLAAPLRGALRLANTALAAAAVSLLASSFWMLSRFHSGGLLPPDLPPVSPSPQAALGRPGGALFAAPPPAAGGRPWPIYAVAGAGVYLLVAALAGMSGLRAGNPRRLRLYIALLAGAVLAEAAALVVLFAAPAWRRRLPDDPSGWWPEAQAFADAHARVVKLAGLGLMLWELVVVGLASWLETIYQEAWEAWVDATEVPQGRARELAGPSVERTWGGGGETWGARRMRDKYGLRPAEWEAGAARARQAALLADDAPAAAAAPAPAGC